jgi:hypothetical protein
MRCERQEEGPRKLFASENRLSSRENQGRQTGLQICRQDNELWAELQSTASRSRGTQLRSGRMKTYTGISLACGSRFLGRRRPPDKTLAAAMARVSSRNREKTKSISGSAWRHGSGFVPLQNTMSAGGEQR